MKTLSKQVAEGGSTESWLLGYQMPHVLGAGPAVGGSLRKKKVAASPKLSSKSYGSLKDKVGPEHALLGSDDSNSESEDSVLGADEQEPK